MTFRDFGEVAYKSLCFLVLIAAVAVPLWILFQCFPFFVAVAGGVTALLSGIHSVAQAVVFLMMMMAFAIAASVFKL